MWSNIQRRQRLYDFHRFQAYCDDSLEQEQLQRVAVIPRLGDSSLKEGPATEELLKLVQPVKRYFQRI
ncbi:hypothetical protein D9M69_637070 [compost metagenome]